MDFAGGGLVKKVASKVVASWLTECALCGYRLRVFDFLGEKTERVRK